MSRVAAHLSRRLAALVEARTDGQLLSAFLADRDEGAFAELVRRHGPLVWGACRRLLPDPADAEDAFQATFLVLVRRAHRLTDQSAVGPWLYRVATWTARNARRRNARNWSRRRPLSPAATDPSSELASLDLRADLDAALLALPEKYRTPLVLCHLQGWTRRDAAAAIGCPEGTLSSLLSRGLDRLRETLRSHDPARLLSVGGLGVPALLATSTVRAAVDGKLIAAGMLSSSVSQLAEGVLHMFWVKKATAAAAAMCVVFGTGIGVGVSVRPVPGLAGDGDGPPAKLDRPAATAAPAEIDALKAEVAAAEEVQKAAEEGIKLTRQKLELTRRVAEKGQAAAAEVLQDQITLVRFEENAANARLYRAAALSRLRAAEQPARRGLFEGPDKPAARPTPADLDLLKGELAAAEDALKATTEGVRLVKEKVELVRKQADRGAVSKADLLQEQFALTQFEEHAANAQQKRLAVVAALRAAEGQLKEKPAAAKPAAPPDEFDFAYQQLLRDIADVRVEQESIKSAHARLAELERKEREMRAAVARIQAQRAERAKAAPAAANKAAPAPANFLFHLTVGGTDAAWPYQVKEYGPDGNAIGTAAFDNTAALAKYFARVAKDPTTPKGVEVRILAPKDLPADRVLEAAKAIKAAGLPFVATVLDDTQRIDDLVRGKLLKANLQRADGEREQAGDALRAMEAARQKDIEAKLKAEIDALTKRLHELGRKKAADMLNKFSDPAKSNPTKP